MPVIEANNMFVGVPIHASAVSVKFLEEAALKTPRQVSAEIHALYKLLELTTMDIIHISGTMRSNHKK
jgi:hypothetical protein